MKFESLFIEKLGLHFRNLKDISLKLYVNSPNFNNKRIIFNVFKCKNYSVINELKCTNLNRFRTFTLAKRNNEYVHLSIINFSNSMIVSKYSL
jgi:hypothetical protein